MPYMLDNEPMGMGEYDDILLESRRMVYDT